MMTQFPSGNTMYIRASKLAQLIMPTELFGIDASRPLSLEAFTCPILSGPEIVMERFNSNLKLGCTKALLRSLLMGV